MGNKPRIRFKGFTEDWEQRKLGDIVDFLDGQRKPLKESDRIKGKYPYYGASGIIDYINDYLFDENLVLLSEDGANIIDRNYPVCFIATGKYWVNNHAHVLKVKTGVIDKFICESLERLDYTKFNTGTAQPKLNQDICQKIVITIPNEDEQKCISEFLDRINNIITLHQCKLEKLKLTKKALLQKLFPKNGKDIPEIRFKGFIDAWEQRKFGEIMTFLNGRAYKQDELLGDGKYKVLRVGNFYTNDSWYYSNLELDDKFYATNGDLLYTWSATFGPHIWKGEKVIYHYHIWKLVLQDKIDKLFALQLLEVDKANIMSDKNGSTMVHITKQGMENKQTILPISLNEQKQIAKFLSSMDKLITLHQRKLERLQEVKKGLLQKMFV